MAFVLDEISGAWRAKRILIMKDGRRGVIGGGYAFHGPQP